MTFLNQLILVILAHMLVQVTFSKDASSLPPLHFSDVSSISTPTEPLPFFVRLKILDEEGDRGVAIDGAEAYLKTHPTDSDVRLFLAQMYVGSQDLLKAREDLLTVLRQSPGDVDASLVLLNLDIERHFLKEALDVVNFALIFHPLDPDLLKKRADVANLMAPPVVVLRAPKVVVYPTVFKREVIHKPVAEVTYLNEVGLYQQQYYISDVKRMWDYSTLYYGRQTSLGKVYGKMNYSNRVGKQAVQGEFEAYPKINNYLYLDVDFAYANQPNLFPGQVYGLEAYVSVPKTVDFSAGAKYNIVDNRHEFTVYTASLSKLFRQNFVTFRPYYFVPGVGAASVLYTLNLRHIVLDPDYYFGCVLGYGNSPDLANLETVGFIVVRNKIVNPYVNFPLLHNRLIVNLGFLYQNQLFPRQHVRDWTGGTIGLRWRY
ncbi:MAG: YaiO family outer membrane beta-barrel protein [Legionellales bacterium]|nr:YaiO family outer membrane beta-barrel protein [Legionellales bacterium]